MLTLDRAVGDKWMVASGVSTGDRVVVEGLQKVRPGASVKEVPFDAGGEPGAKPKNPIRPAAGTSGGR
jgi:membrane fusion protein (multidrug efflux system)